MWRQDHSASYPLLSQRYFANGEPWGTNYCIVGNRSVLRISKSPVVAANSSQIVFAWQDNLRSKGWDIYAKVVSWDWEGNLKATPEDNLSKKFVLSQLYTKPTPVTSITYKLTKPSRVILRVYNSLGREVSTLVNGFKPMGEHSMQWDMRRIPRGLYFYKLQIDGYVETKKFVLVK